MAKIEADFQGRQNVRVQENKDGSVAYYANIEHISVAAKRLGAVTADADTIDGHRRLWLEDANGNEIWDGHATKKVMALPDFKQPCLFLAEKWYAKESRWINVAITGSVKKHTAKKTTL